MSGQLKGEKMFRGIAVSDGVCRGKVVVLHRSRRVIAKRVLTDDTVVPEIKRFEGFTGHRSKRNLTLYGRMGYQPFKEVPFNKEVTWVYLEKNRS